MYALKLPLVSNSNGRQVSVHICESFRGSRDRQKTRCCHRFYWKRHMRWNYEQHRWHQYFCGTVCSSITSSLMIAIINSRLPRLSIDLNCVHDVSVEVIGFSMCVDVVAVCEYVGEGSNLSTFVSLLLLSLHKFISSLGNIGRSWNSVIPEVDFSPVGL